MEKLADVVSIQFKGIASLQTQMLYKALGEAKILGQITASKMTIMLHEEFNFPRAGGRIKPEL